MYSVIHIVPQLPPQNSGVGDYATLVGRRMEELGEGVVCGYVAAGHEAVELPANEPHVRNITGRCDAESLWQAVEELAADEQKISGGVEQESSPVAVVLNYSGYGYERNGCPAWLVDALRNRPATIGRVATFFHELYATGRPWRRAFWYSSRQRRITAEIARLSDALLTNRAASARWLETRAVRPSGSIRSLPTPSNVGEMATLICASNRDPIAVCFGAAQFKQCFTTRLAPFTAAICNAVGAERMINIGEPIAIDKQPFAERSIRFEQLGYLPAAEASAWLARSRVAFVTYYPDFLAKSGSIAAFAAHGIATIMTDECSRVVDGLTPGQHYLLLSEAGRLADMPTTLCERLDAVGHCLFEWYQSHDIRVHTTALLENTLNSPARAAGLAAACSQAT